MNLIKALLAPSLRTENKGLKEMRAWTRRERGVSPTHLGRSSFPSSYSLICTDAAALVSDAAAWTAQGRPLGGRGVAAAVALPLAEMSAERFWSGEDRAIVVFCYVCASDNQKDMAMLHRKISFIYRISPRGFENYSYFLFNKKTECKSVSCTFMQNILYI